MLPWNPLMSVINRRTCSSPSPKLALLSSTCPHLLIIFSIFILSCTMLPQQAHGTSNSVSLTITPDVCINVHSTEPPRYPCSVFTSSTTTTPTPTSNPVAPESSSESCAGSTSDDVINNTRFVSIPFTKWATGNEFSVFMRMESSLLEYVRNISEEVSTSSSPIVPLPVIEGGRDMTYQFLRPVLFTNEGYAEVRLQFTGTVSLSGRYMVVYVPTNALFACPAAVSLIGEGQYIPFTVRFEEAPGLSATQPITTTAVVIGAATSIITGLPGGLVRAGIVSSLRTMSRCSDFNSFAKIDAVSNPSMWAVGASELQYQRGSVLIGVITLFLGGVTVVIGVVVMRETHRASTILGAFRELRLPSIFAVPILIASTFSMRSLSTMIFHHRTATIVAAVAADYLIVIAVLFAVMSFLGWYVYTTTYGCQVGVDELHKSNTDMLPLSWPPTTTTTPRLSPRSRASSSSTGGVLRVVDAAAAGNCCENGTTTGKSHPPTKNPSSPTSSFSRRFQNVVVFLLCPTHGPSALMSVPASSTTEEAATGRENTEILLQRNVSFTESVRRNEHTAHLIESEHWLSGNYFFVLGWRWIPFGAIEAIVGVTVTFLSGVPVTGGDARAWCMLPPVLTAILLFTLLLLLVWKHPFTIRFKQYSTTLAVVLMFTANLCIVYNLTAAGYMVDVTTDVLLILSSAVLALQCLVDVLLLLWLSIATTSKIATGASATSPSTTMAPPLHSLVMETSLGSLLRNMRDAAREKELAIRQSFNIRHGRGEDPGIPYLVLAEDRTTTDPDVRAWNLLAAKLLVHRLRRGKRILAEQQAADAAELL